jgi:hypothetical protein
MTDRALEVASEGVQELAAALALEDDIPGILRAWVTGAGEAVAGLARARAPVNSGALRRSINIRVESSATDATAFVGSNKFYAPYMEFGTGLRHDHPSWPRKRHLIPEGALDAWAAMKSRGGTPVDPNAVRSAIMKAGGLKPRRYLRSSLEDLEPKIIASADKMADEILRRLGK